MSRPQRPHSRKALETESRELDPNLNELMASKATQPKGIGDISSSDVPLVDLLQGLKGHTAERHWRRTRIWNWRGRPGPASKATQPKGIGDILAKFRTNIFDLFGLKGHTAERHWRRECDGVTLDDGDQASKATQPKGIGDPQIGAGV